MSGYLNSSLFVKFFFKRFTRFQMSGVLVIRFYYRHKYRFEYLNLVFNIYVYTLNRYRSGTRKGGKWGTDVILRKVTI